METDLLFTKIKDFPKKKYVSTLDGLLSKSETTEF